MIPNKVPSMQEPLRTLVLEGIKAAGCVEESEVLCSIEERLTISQFTQVGNFCRWLKKNNQKVGHGTIDLRWYEFKSRRVPASQDEAYAWAMKRMGLL